jgi:hypothetical protein
VLIVARFGSAQFWSAFSCATQYFYDFSDWFHPWCGIPSRG